MLRRWPDRAQDLAILRISPKAKVLKRRQKVRNAKVAESEGGSSHVRPIDTSISPVSTRPRVVDCPRGGSKADERAVSKERLPFVPVCTAGRGSDGACRHGAQDDYAVSRGNPPAGWKL